MFFFFNFLSRNRTEILAVGQYKGFDIFDQILELKIFAHDKIYIFSKYL